MLIGRLYLLVSTCTRQLSLVLHVQIKEGELLALLGDFVICSLIPMQLGAHEGILWAVAAAVRVLILL